MQHRHRLVQLMSLLCFCGILPASAQSPIHQWRLGEPGRDREFIADLVGESPAQIVGNVEFDQSPALMRVSGKANYVSLSPKGTSIPLPTAAISLETWVALDKPTKYNNVIGCLQDNGSFEKGWLLGGHESHFQFAIGTDRLTYLKSETEFEPGRWYHLVGTYDGETMCLYLDGELESTSSKRTGPIQYADSWWRIAGYKDDNETYAFHGRIHEVAIYDQSLTPEQIRRRFEEKKSIFPAPALKPEAFIALGPYLRFDTTSSATIHWHTGESQTSRLQYRMTGESWQDVKTPGLRTKHAITLKNLPHRNRFQYRVLGRTAEQEGISDEIMVNTTFNFTIPAFPPQTNPFPPDELANHYAAAAERILAVSGITNGYCLDYNCGEGRLAVELAKRSNLVIVGINDNAAAVQRARQRLLKSGLYGPRVTLQHAPEGKIPFPDYCFNLVVSDRSVLTGQIPSDMLEVKKHVRPAGGVMMIGKEHYVRPQLEGAGSWTHMYGDAGQSANSHDQLISGKIGENIEVQWFGLPGPDAMIDRLGRNQGPLSYQGRLFTQGDDRLIAQDSYNGRILWSLEIPGMRRTNVKVDTSNSCVDEQAYYLTIRDRCWKIDVVTGQLLGTFQVDPLSTNEVKLDWGYIASDRHLLIGSSVSKGASFSDFHGADKWYDKPTGTGTEKVCSDSLFAIDKDSGTRLWTYERGAILNPTISLGDGLIYFLESRHPKVLESKRGRIGMPELYEDLHLVAMNQESGSIVWEKPVNYGRQPTVIYLSHAQGTLIVQSSLPDDKTYNLFVYEAGDGGNLWQHKYPWRRTDHGHHIQHPVIAGNKLIAQPEFFELRTGKKLGDTPERRKCSTMTGAANLLHYRDFNDEVWDLSTGETSEWKGLRSSCWLGIISADGMILSSESGGGCSCNFPIQLSIGYRTKNDY
ncbi:MAG: outer membrane protein assembly factor BamB [Limisphaerales bacterium]|jgi:outer membrane protein assembly factor BamB/2-polyprenyl-3-methyl-5-hydroxy-6-metoxy-1,4-benzoquinol methylase